MRLLVILLLTFALTHSVAAAAAPDAPAQPPAHGHADWPCDGDEGAKEVETVLLPADSLADHRESRDTAAWPPATRLFDSHFASSLLRPPSA